MDLGCYLWDVAGGEEVTGRLAWGQNQVEQDRHAVGRKGEDETKNCRKLECMEGGEDTPPRLPFKIGSRAITFGKPLTEKRDLQILRALQPALPNAAQQLGSYREGKRHFIALGLS